MKVLRDEAIASAMAAELPAAKVVAASRVAKVRRRSIEAAASANPSKVKFN